MKNPEGLQQEFREGIEQRKKLEDLERELVEEEWGEGGGEGEGKEDGSIEWNGNKELGVESHKESGKQRGKGEQEKTHKVNRLRNRL